MNWVYANEASKFYSATSCSFAKVIGDENQKFMQSKLKKFKWHEMFIFHSFYVVLHTDFITEETFLYDWKTTGTLLNKEQCCQVLEKNLILFASNVAFKEHFSSNKLSKQIISSPLFRSLTSKWSSNRDEMQIMLFNLCATLLGKNTGEYCLEQCRRRMSTSINSHFATVKLSSGCNALYYIFYFVLGFSCLKLLLQCNLK